VNGYDVIDGLNEPWPSSPVKVIDEEGFVYDVEDIFYDHEAGASIIRVKIQKKNGEIE
jgi:hypothetical protein